MAQFADEWVVLFARNNHCKMKNKAPNPIPEELHVYRKDGSFGKCTSVHDFLFIIDDLLLVVRDSMLVQQG